MGLVPRTVFATRSLSRTLQVVRVAIVEPYFGGSHRSWAEGYRLASRHDVTLISHDARFWKWRMQGSFITLAEETREIVDRDGCFDIILASSMLDLAGYLGVLGSARGPAAVALYMHENQLTYPPSPRDTPDETYPMINWSSMVVADAVFFNSRYHHDAWFRHIGVLLNRFPDHTHSHLLEEVTAKSSVLAVGVDLARFDPVARPRNETPILLWNHRWEHDKGPDVLVTALKALIDRDERFHMIVTGEQVPSLTPAREELGTVLGDRLLHAGEVEDDRYVELVASADVVISTARQEFFGISVTEAMYSGSFPVLPCALVYPERIPVEHHGLCLYDGLDELVDRCAWAIENRDAAADIASRLAATMARFDWSVMGPEYDQKLEHLTR
jgi:glycosyltransferase involved in cell wall biosynthesis